MRLWKKKKERLPTVPDVVGTGRSFFTVKVSEVHRPEEMIIQVADGITTTVFLKVCQKEIAYTDSLGFIDVDVEEELPNTTKEIVLGRR